MIVCSSRRWGSISVKINYCRATRPGDLIGVDELTHVRARRADGEARERKRKRRDSSRALQHCFNTLFSGLFTTCLHTCTQTNIHFDRVEETIRLCPIVRIIPQIPSRVGFFCLYFRMCKPNLMPGRGGSALASLGLARYKSRAPLTRRLPPCRPHTHKYGRGALGFSCAPLPQLSHAPDFSFPAAPAAAVTPYPPSEASIAKQCR